MKEDGAISITSLLCVVLLAFHVADDIVRGMEPGGLSTLFAVIILVVWLYGIVVLAGRRSGYVIVLLGSLLAIGASVVHMTGGGLAGGRIANSSGVYFWTWTLIALGVTGGFSAILAVRGLWLSGKK